MKTNRNSSKHNSILIVFFLITIAAAIVALINKLIFIYSTAKDHLSSEKSNTYKWRFGDISYTREGDGKPILLIHDLSSSSCNYEWNKVKKAFAKKHTVYTIDLLGCGKSDKPGITYTNYLYVQLITDFVRTVIGHRVDVITSGRSSSIAIMACNLNQDIFDKLIFVNPESFLESRQSPNRKSRFFKFVIELPIIGTLLYNITYNRKNITDALMVTKYSDPYKVTSDEVNAFHESAHRKGLNSKLLYSSIKGNYTAIPVENALKGIDNSIYIIGGSDYPNIDERMEEYRSTNLAVEGTVIKDTAAYPHMERPEEFAKTVSIFLD